MHYRARSYDPETGRFTSRDPVWNSNLYHYCDNDPVSNADPSGSVIETDFDRMQELQGRYGPHLKITSSRELGLNTSNSTRYSLSLDSTFDIWLAIGARLSELGLTDEDVGDDEDLLFWQALIIADTQTDLFALMAPEVINELAGLEAQICNGDRPPFATAEAIGPEWELPDYTIGDVAEAIKDVGLAGGGFCPSPPQARRATRKGTSKKAVRIRELEKRGFVGPYSRVKGHHVHAKRAFEESTKYDPKTGFSFSAEAMEHFRIRHKEITAHQRRLFSELAKSGRPNTMAEHTRIAIESLEAAGASPALARALVAASLRDLLRKGVTKPTSIPWEK
jgi:hypothetical protein